MTSFSLDYSFGSDSETDWERDLATMTNVSALLGAPAQYAFFDSSAMQELGSDAEIEAEDVDDEYDIRNMEEWMVGSATEDSISVDEYDMQNMEEIDALRNEALSPRLYWSSAEDQEDDDEDSEEDEDVYWKATAARAAVPGEWGLPGPSALKRHQSAPREWGAPATMLKRHMTPTRELKDLANDDSSGGDDSSEEEEDEEERIDRGWWAPGMSLLKRHRTPSEEAISMDEIRRLTGLGGRDVREVLVNFADLVDVRANTIGRDDFNFGFGQLMGTTDAAEAGGRGGDERATYVLARLYDIFDRDGSGVVDFIELGAALSVLCGGSSVERARAAFDLHDVNGDGVITFEEMETHMLSVFKVAFASDPSVQVKARGLGPSDLARISTRRAFDDADADRNGVLTWDEFKRWFVANGDSVQAINNALRAAMLIDEELAPHEAEATLSFAALAAPGRGPGVLPQFLATREKSGKLPSDKRAPGAREQRDRGTSATSIEEALEEARRAWSLEAEQSAEQSAEQDDDEEVSVLLFTVTFYANRAHNLTRSP